MTTSLFSKEFTFSDEDLETLQAMEDRIDLDDARKALLDVKKHGTIPWDSIKRKLAL